MNILGSNLIAMFFLCLFRYDNHAMLETDFVYLCIVSVIICNTVPIISFYPLINGVKSIRNWHYYYLVTYALPFIFLWTLLGVYMPEYHLLGYVALLFGGMGIINFVNTKYLSIPIIVAPLAYLVQFYVHQREFLETNAFKFIISTGIFLLGSLFFIVMSKQVTQQNEKINALLRSTRRGKRLLDEEKKKSENLLLNILPFEIIEDLKKNGASTPKFYTSASVLFTDFVGFTQIAGNLEPETLVRELDNCFTYFDSVTRKYRLEKIKTIGDSYMACGGLPAENFTHPIDAVLAALEIQSFMTQMKEIKKQQKFPYWELRLGINTGPLIAAVIGEMKFAYDVFGDTVNTASRMESSGHIGKINISKHTYDFVERLFDCEYRGEVEAKSKGLMDMYFVHGIKKYYSRNREGRVPNEKFFREYLKIRKFGYRK